MRIKLKINNRIQEYCPNSNVTKLPNTQSGCNLVVCGKPDLIELIKLNYVRKDIACCKQGLYGVK